MGTIEKSSDILTFHLLLLSFSSLLHLVNHHKLIPHQLPIQKHSKPQHSPSEQHKNLTNSHYAKKKATATAI
jgi:hypothetical protein